MKHEIWAEPWIRWAKGKGVNLLWRPSSNHKFKVCNESMKLHFTCFSMQVMKERLVIFFCLLLCAVSVSDAAICLSNQGCPNNGTVCLINCSAVAVEQFNQSASQGNCRLSVTSRTTYEVYGCFINDCNTSYPEMCLPELTADETGFTCCCTIDVCNNDFHTPPPSSIAIQVHSVCMYNSILLQPCLVLM